MISRQIVGWGLVLVCVGWPQTLLAEMEETPVASIELEREVHFVSPDEANVIVPPGFYTVEATDNGLQLVHGLLPDEGGDVFLLRTKPGTHQESEESPIARSLGIGEDAHYLSLLLPDGQSLVAIGSYSGVRPRGAGWLERLSQKAEKALVAAKGKYEEVTEWNRLCKKRYTKANAINTCCTNKYQKCKRVCRKKGKQRVSCQQQCETLNEGCWIRRDPNPNWMVNYCGNTKNQRRKGMSVCCQRMEKRCKQSCQAFPKSGRDEFCGRCTKAANLCQSNTREEFFEEGDTIEVKRNPRSTKIFTFLDKRWKSKKEIYADERAGYAILTNQLLKPAHKVAKTLADFTKNPLRPDDAEGAAKEIGKMLKDFIKNPGSWPLHLGKATLAGMLDSFLAHEAGGISRERMVMYTHFAEGVVSVLDPSLKPKVNRPGYDAFIQMGIKAVNSFTHLERYQLAIALIRQYCHSHGLNSCSTEEQLSLSYHKKNWDSSTFLRGMQREYQRGRWAWR